MKTILFTLVIVSTLLSANEQTEHKYLPYDQSLAIFKTIHNDAIVFGSGKKLVYVFVDPLCPHSRKFMTLISKNPMMTSKYQYHIFLYSIPRLKSKDVISAIYMSKAPLESLLEIMLEDKVRHEKGDKKTETKINRIETAAIEMDVHKRPYIFVELKHEEKEI